MTFSATPNHRPFRFEAEHAPIPIFAAEWLGDNPADARIFYQNDRSTQLYGDHCGKLLADFLGELDPGANNACGTDLLDKLLHDGKLDCIQGNIGEKRVELFAKVQSFGAKRIQCTAIDVTERLLDPLTKLPGRSLLFDRLNISLNSAKRNHEDMAVLLLDLDGFKQANDLFGHKMGDSILQQVGSRLRSMLRQHETVARIGGDEFVLVLNATNPLLGLKVSEQKIIPALNRPYSDQCQTVDFIGASIGIACHPKHGSEADLLIKRADDAMYRAKRNGKNQAMVY